MPDFDEIFSSTKERPVIYDGYEVVRMDLIPFKDSDVFQITIESTNSKHVQGIAMDIDGSFVISGKSYEHQIVIWENSAPKSFLLTTSQNGSAHDQSNPPKGLFRIFNVWDNGQGAPESSYWGAAMRIEEIESGKRYRCNDGKPDDDFDDIIFTVQRVIE